MNTDTWVVMGREKLTTVGWFKYGPSVELAELRTREEANQTAETFKPSFHVWVALKINGTFADVEGRS